MTSRPVHSPVAPRRATPSSPVPGFHVLARPAGFAVTTRPGFPRRPHSQAPPWLYPYGAHPPCPLPGIPRRPPSRVLPRPSLPVSPVTSCPRLPRGPSARGLPRGPRPGLPRGPPSRGLTRRPPSQWFCKGKGFIQLVDTHPKEEKVHTPRKGCCFIPCIFSMCMHGPVRNGVLADIVLVVPHVHAAGRSTFGGAGAWPVVSPGLHGRVPCGGCTGRAGKHILPAADQKTLSEGLGRLGRRFPKNRLGGEPVEGGTFFQDLD